MVELDYREILFIVELIGVIGQNIEGKIFINAKSGQFEKVLRSFIAPIKVEEAVIEDDISVSSSRVVLPSNTKWLAALDQGLPPEYLALNIQTITKKEFDELEF